jgi:EmrB/QacA subfamily drug resistance transporter
MSSVSDTRRVTAVVGVLSLAVFMSSLDLFIVNLAFPYISRQYPGTSLSSLSWVLNAYTIVFAAVLVPAGRWADRVGRRRLFAVGMAGFSLGSVLCGLAPGVGALIAARIVQAAGAGAMVPASLSLLLAAVPPAARPKAIGTWSALGALGAALGPVIGGALVQVNWRWVFWINVPVGLAAMVLAGRVVPESRDGESRGRPDVIGAGLLAAAVGLVALALVKAPEWGWGSARFVGLLAASVVCGTAMVFRSRRHHSPVIELELLRVRSFSGAFTASILYYAGFGAFVLSTVEFLTGVWHYSAVEAGLAIAPGPLMVLPFARVAAPRLAARLGGPGRVAAIGCFVNALAQLLWLWRIQAQPAYVSHLLPAQLLGGAGVGLTIPSLLGAGSAGLTPARFGTGSGILNMARQIGTVLGVAGLVAILARVSHADPVAAYRNGLLLVIGFFAAAGVMSAGLLAGRPTPVPASSAPPAPAEGRETPVEAAAGLQVQGGAGFQAGDLGAGRGGGHVHQAGDQAEAVLVEDRVVDAVAAGRGDGAEVIDHLRCLQPRGADGEQERVHRVLGDGEGVAGVEQLGVDQETGVHHERDVRVDERVVHAVDVHVEAGDLERVAVLDLVHPVAELAELGADRLVGPQGHAGIAGQRGADRVRVQVVRVLVGDHDRGGAVQGGGRVAPAARVDDQGGAVLLQPDARVPELGEPHGLTIQWPTLGEWTA